jgi:hypothetical protein
VLTQRLGELEEAGVLRRREMGPPVSGRVYELTEWGRDLEPALLALSAWGSRAPLPPAGPELSVDALALALRTTFDSAGAEDVICEFRLDGDVLTVAVTGGRLAVTRGAAARPAAIVEATAAGLRSVIFGRRSWADGGLTLRGDRAAVTRLLRRFPRPVPVPDRPGSSSDPDRPRSAR